MLPITVFTPTYNRRNKITRVYRSLLKQDNTLFEWLIIDDGSNDGTEKTIQELVKQSPFKINYFYQENGGKHRAHNKAVDYAIGDLFIILDSDDEILPNKLKLIWDTWNKFNKNNKNYAGILAHSIDQNGKLVGRLWPKNTYVKSVVELWLDDESAYGEKMPIYVTEILKNYKFPSLEGSNELVPEGVVWFQIAKKYKMILLNDITRVYEVNNFDALSKSAHSDKVAVWGKSIFFAIAVDLSNRYFFYRPLRFIKIAINTSRYRYLSNISYHEQNKFINNISAKILVILFIPIAKLLLIYKKIRNNFGKVKK